MLTGDFFEMDSYGRKRAAESTARCEALCSPRGKGQMRGRRGVVDYQVLELTRIRVSTASSRDRDEYAGMVTNMVVSQENEISPAATQLLT